jgi:endonuclease G
VKYFYLLIVFFLTACSSIPITADSPKETGCFVSDQELENWSYQQNFQLVKNQYYEVIYDNKNIEPFLVEYKLKYSKLTHKLRRNSDYKNSFKPDRRVHKSSSNAQYKKSGWDKGHMAPAEDFSFSPEAAESTFLYSNISPQNPFFNRHGAWRKLETKTRAVSSGNPNPIQVLIGPIIKGRSRLNNLKDSPVIPDSFFKVIIQIKNDHCNYSAFVLKNDSHSKDFCDDRLDNKMIPKELSNHLMAAKAHEIDLCE